MKILLKILMLLSIVMIPISISASSLEEDEASIVLHYFFSPNCLSCGETSKFLEDYLAENDDIVLLTYNVMESEENEELFIRVSETYGRNQLIYPYISVGGKDLQGFYEIESDLKKVVDYYRSNPNYADIVDKILNNQDILTEDFLTIDFFQGRTVILPIIGEIELSSFSLFLGAIFIGLIDGFNPCAMWILVFLITLLINMQNKKKMWILGLTFILTSGIIYYLIMMSWLHLVIRVAMIQAFQIAIGILALVFAFFSLKHFWRQHQQDTGCEVTSTESKKRLMIRAKKVINNNNLWLAIIGIAGIAITVNIIELACSAGLPVIYTTMLAYHNLSNFQSAMYILVYVLFFIFDDLLVFTIAVITFKITGISNKYTKYSNLFGGIIMIILGIILIFFPGLLL